jgi:hypothetical protein
MRGYYKTPGIAPLTRTTGEGWRTSVCDLAAQCARALPERSPSKQGRAQGRPGACRPHGPRATKSTRQNHRFGQTSRPSLRDGLHTYTCSPRGSAFLPPSLTRRVNIFKLSASTGAPGPHDFVVRMTSFVRAQAHCDIIRPSHPTSHVRDDRDTPLLRGSRMRQFMQVICPTTQADSFLQND